MPLCTIIFQFSAIKCEAVHPESDRPLPRSAHSDRLLRDLSRFLPRIAERLSVPGAWLGLRLTEPEAGGRSYLRLVARDELASPRRAYMVGAHTFPRGERGALHNHIYPLAVLPFAADALPGTPLYDMPWEQRAADGRVLARGQRTVLAGEPYALAPCLSIFHAVHSRAAHQSLTLADVTDGPQRPNRLTIEALPDDRAEVLRAALDAALQRFLSRSPSGRPRRDGAAT